MPESGRRAARDLFAAPFLRAAGCLARGLVFLAMGELLRALWRLALALGLGVETRRIEADIHHVGVENGRARHRERQVLFDMHERHTGLPRTDRNRQLIELADDGLRRRPLLHHRHAQRNIDLTWPARGTEQHAPLDA